MQKSGLLLVSVTILTKAFIMPMFFIALISQTVLAAPEDEFVTTWKTDNPGASNDTSIRIPMGGGPFEVDWEDDGVFDGVQYNGSVLHDYGTAGTYTVRIRGTYGSITFAGGGDKDKILSIDQWGSNAWTTMSAAFLGASNLTVPATDTPDFSLVKNMSSMFTHAPLVNPDTSGWNTAAVTTMWSMFASASSADPDTSSWVTSAVKDMGRMFSGAVSANPEVSGWNTSAVTSMSEMFRDAFSFDQDLGSWNVTALKSATNMFRSTTLSTKNYDSLLIGWDAQDLQPGVFFSGGNSKYCSNAAVAARENMIVSDEWFIVDGGQQCPPDMVFADGFE